MTDAGATSDGPGRSDVGDRRLAEAVRAGDAEAFETLFRAYYEPLCAFAEGFTGGADAAEDLVIEVFGRIWKKRADWTVTRSVRAYLYGAVRNRALHLVEHRRVVAEARDRIVRDRMRPGRGSPGDDPEAHVIGVALGEAVRDAVEELPPRCRETFVLSRVHGMTYREIAEVMEVSVRTVENQVARALQLLRRALADWL